MAWDGMRWATEPCTVQLNTLQTDGSSSDARSLGRAMGATYRRVKDTTLQRAESCDQAPAAIVSVIGLHSPHQSELCLASHM